MKKTICLLGLFIPLVCHAGKTSGKPISPQLAEIAVQDLASRLNLSPELITVINMTPVIWPDSSLGCPQEGVTYQQVEADGFIVTLEANALRYPYHTDTGQRVVWCENPQLPVFPVAPGEIDDGQPWVPVK